MEKSCRECGETKLVGEFHRDRSKPDGLNFYCKPCTIVRHKRFLMRPPRHIAPEGMKRCAHCKETKNVVEFSRSTKTYDSRAPRCKACNYEYGTRWRLNNPERAAEQQRAWREKNPERAKDHMRKKNYGVPIGWYAETLAAQGGVCAACGTTEPGGKGDFHVDHCHDSGNIRALLCAGCNLAIGHLRNDPDAAEAVKQYLLRHKA